MLVCGQWVLVRNAPSPLEPLLAWRPAGAALIGLGITLMAVAGWSFHRHHTTILPFADHSNRLIDSGVFRLSRNPIYLAESILLSGIALSTGHLWPWVAVPVFVVGINVSVIAWEERALQQRFGRDYQDYCRRTRRWF